jgi:hypothetical protein
MMDDCVIKWMNNPQTRQNMLAMGTVSAIAVAHNQEENQYYITHVICMS